MILFGSVGRSGALNGQVKLLKPTKKADLTKYYVSQNLSLLGEYLSGVKSRKILLDEEFPLLCLLAQLHFMFLQRQVLHLNL